MTKYDGVRIVSSGHSSPKSTSSQRSRKNEAWTSYSSSFLSRIFFAMLLICAVFGAKLISHPFAEEAVGYIKTAVTFDLNPNSDGETTVAFIELIKTLFE